MGKAGASVFAEIYDVTAAGNFEGHNILNRLNAIEFRDDETETRLAAMRAILLGAAREACEAQASTTRCSPTGTDCYRRAR